MGIVMAGLSPHPPIIIPEIGGDRAEEAENTINSMKEISREIVEMAPDILITISPHGPVFKDGISVLDKPELSGNFANFGHPEVGFSVESDLNFIEKLERNVSENSYELVRLSQSNRKNSAVSNNLDHGVLVPLYYLKEAGLEVPIVALTMGLLDYNKLYEFGFILQQVLNQAGYDGVVLASGDLSHRLKPGAPAGYNPKGEEFDKKLVKLLKDKNFKEIMNMDSGLIKKAGECGLRPVIIMLGSVKDLNVSTDVKSYEGPFGVGYSVAGIYREEA